MKQQRGMTLPEVLIALLVFAAIASTSVYALRLGIDSRDQLTTADQSLKAFQIARTLMKEDFAQLAMRPVRDEFGNHKPAAFLGNLTTFGGNAADDEKTLAAFVRDGWINPGARLPRSALQHVEYVFKGDALIRRARIYLDETTQSDVSERVLFEGLTTARAAFLTGEARGELVWTDIWPISDSRTGAPRAVSITVERDGEPPVVQYFWIGALINDQTVGAAP